MDADALLLRLDGFEGPLDLLLDLARTQKVDLAKISILALVEQYLAVIEGAREIRLELAADWLVMAAWLTWLKSRLLLPEPPDAEEEAPSAAALTERLEALQAMRAAAGWLAGRPQWGFDVFGRGAPEDFRHTDRSKLKLELSGLLAGYLAARRRAGGQRRYAPKPMTFFSVKQALARLETLLGSRPAWSTLESFLPEELDSGLPRRAAISATLLASLELAKSGAAKLRQETQFGPILMHKGGDGAGA